MNSMIINRQKILENLIEKMVRVMHDINLVSGLHFGNCLLKRQQIMILFFIYEKQGIASVKEIAKFLQVTPGAVTQAVDYLVEKKIVRREENLNDRRIVNVKLSKATEKDFDRFKKNFIKEACKSFKDFNDHDLQNFIRLVEKIKTPNFQKIKKDTN